MAKDTSYTSWTNTKGSKEAAFAAYEKASKDIPSVTRSYYQPFKNVEPNTSIRDGFNRRDYDAVRPDEAVGHSDKLICQVYDSYRHLGIVQNIIDLMVDFVVQDMHLVHPIKQGQKFYEAWWSKVDGLERSERIANCVFLSARAIVQRNMGLITVQERKRFKKGQTIGVNDDIPQIRKNNIPLKYTMHNPVTVKPIGGNLGLFAGDQKYALIIPSDILAKVKSPKTPSDFQIVADMPEELVAAIRLGAKEIPLDNKNISVLHYRKNDWEQWGAPMLESVMTDLITLTKLRLADQTALDGAISHIRIWKLGSLEHKILPGPAAMARLADQLLNNVGGGAMDLIWGPELELQETSTDLHHFLGKEKYVPTLEAIYSGLGIPSTLTGSAGASGGFTNNFVGIQTLLERLKYVRNILIEFWEKEIALVQKAMGYAKPAIIKFSKMTLTDEASIKTLILNMYDRNIISLETAQEILGEDSDLERIRMTREQKQRDKGTLSRKAGPWNNPEQKEALDKIALQTGQLTPTQVGLEPEPKKPGEKLMMEVPSTAPIPGGKKKGKPGQGRPKNKKDSSKRKAKRVLPRSKAEQIKAINWARKAQLAIAEIIDPIWLETTGKKNLRSLSEAEFEQNERVKFAILDNLDLFQEVNEDTVFPLVNDANLCNFKETTDLYLQSIAGLDKPTISELREIQVQSYIFSMETDDGKGTD